tara:strand:+ start:6132 stop:6872 length:741 start_codon:yes stop_codon:yes gene_type:complete
MHYHNPLSPLLTDFSYSSLKCWDLVFSFSLTHNPSIEPLCNIILSDDEILRSNRYLTETSANQFRLTRTYLRLILGHFLPTLPHDISFQKSKHGKLFIQDSLLFFNLSHSQNRGVIVISSHELIGIDLEYIKPRHQYQNIAKRYFSLIENNWLDSQPRSLQISSFYDIWTGKEAIAKNVGLGLLLDFTSFSVIPIHSQISATLFGHETDQSSTQFLLHYIPINNHYSCCFSSTNHLNTNYKLITLS